MGSAADFKVGYKKGFGSGAREKNMYPHFSKCGGTSKQISSTLLTAVKLGLLA